ncbi:hypothetical protein [Microbulbifer sp. SAOS-129_SWC]|uniref:DUF7673 family protein n=1 Tax=Microbulbifer sp. SAOS-129_SWC TaxID=3145235 RepID=UPI0032177D13
MSMNAVTLTQYQRSILALLKLERGNTGASEIAALVLLSAWNSYDFAVPVADLCRLDSDNFHHAMNTIELRYHGAEPHRLVPNGNEEFEALCQRWAHLKTNERTEAAA